MTEDPDEAETIAAKARRMERARKTGGDSAWYGLGMFGMVGWAVAVPLLLGIGLGLWLDGLWPDGPSWTLTGLLGGVALGCLNAWYWVQREGRRDD